jgi:hypothetical protein
MPRKKIKSSTIYQLGSCYICSKCLYCFEIDKENCICDKNIRPSKVKNTLPGQQFYPRAFSPDISFSQASKLLQDANIEFQYGTDFNSSFSYTLCSACNSKYQRAKYKNKNNPAEILLQDDGSDDAATTSSEIEELKLSIIIEDKQKNNAAKTLIISPVDFDNVIEKIHLYTQKSLGDRKLNVFDYSLQYKALNSRGTANTLEEETDFNDFLDEYKKIIGSNKKMGISVILNSIYINNIQKRKKNNKKVCNYNNIIIINYIKYFIFIFTII